MFIQLHTYDTVNNKKHHTVLINSQSIRTITPILSNANLNGSEVTLIPTKGQRDSYFVVEPIDVISSMLSKANPNEQMIVKGLLPRPNSDPFIKTRTLQADELTV